MRVTITDIRDFECLLGCGAVLAAVKDLVLIGTSRPSAGMYKLFSMLHHVERINLRLGSTHFVHELAFASYKPCPFTAINGNTCLALSTLLIHGVSIQDLKRLITCREAQCYAQLKHVVISDLAGGSVVSVDMWLRHRAIEFSRVENGVQVQ